MTSYYTPSHEWIRVEGKEGMMGISHYAQKELGEIVYVELPPLGKKIEAGDVIAVVESTKAATDIYAPLSGKIVRVNEALGENPSLINSSSEGEGWIALLEVDDLSKVEKLLNKSAYEALLHPASP